MASIDTQADHVLVGTSSWTDETLIESGKFYPRPMRPAKMRRTRGAHHVRPVTSRLLALRQLSKALVIGLK